MTRRGLSSLALVLCAACTASPPSPQPAPASSSQIGVSASLGGDTVARVGSDDIPRSLVKEVMGAQKLPARDVARLLVEESLLSQAARRMGAGDDPAVRLRSTSALARALVARWTAEARDMGPFTEEEVGAVMGDDWVELDRPETRVVAHALIRAGATDGANVAKALRDKLSTSAPMGGGGDVFLADAQAFALPPGVVRVVEKLPDPFTVDGRVASRSGIGLDVTFTKAAFALEKVGSTSEVVVTPFGWHVIRLLEIRPAFRAPFTERVRKLEGALLRARALGKYEARIKELRAAAKVQLLGVDADLALPRGPERMAPHPEAAP